MIVNVLLDWSQFFDVDFDEFVPQSKLKAVAFTYCAVAFHNVNNLEI